MENMPSALSELVDAFMLLPGVGSRSAERYAYSVLKKDKLAAAKISSAVAGLHDNIDYCEITFALVEKGQKLSKLYTDKRDKSTVIVVAEPLDIYAIEKTGLYQGTYHVLGGLLSPIDDINPEQLHITELIQRIENDHVNEIILATNASVEGESTALYLSNKLEGSKVKITRLARGLPIGVDIEYADQLTLGKALEGRQAL